MSKRYQAGILTASYNGLKVPNAPTIGTATAGAGSASVTFTAPSDVGGGAITSYTVISSPGSITGTGSSSPVTVSGLTNGTAYTFTVVATNAYGTGPASAASNSVTPSVNYIEEVFSTYLYTGNGSTNNITNGINLATYGGLVWMKDRTNAYEHYLLDTARGNNSILHSNNANAASVYSNGSFSVFTTGFTVTGSGTDSSSIGGDNESGDNYASWTFRKQPKFFDIVTYSGNSTAGRTVAHNLGSVPGCMIVRDLLGGPWYVYHQSIGNTKTLVLNTTDAPGIDPSWNNTTPTATVFTLGDNYQVNYTGHTYVAYLFASNAGGFGLTGTDNVITCGIAYSNSTVNLGYEPQWIMDKDLTAGFNWNITDNMRGNGTQSANVLKANSTAAEVNSGTTYFLKPTATGFTVPASYATGAGFIYIAIRRGPMAVPTSGTSVFTPVQNSNFTAGVVIAGQPTVDMVLNRQKDAVNYNRMFDRLRGSSGSTNLVLYTSTTDAETNTAVWALDQQNGVRITQTVGTYNYVNYLFSRAPNFFDEVCYTGTGSTTTFNHNLGVAPELMIIKSRSDALGWRVYAAPAGNTGYLVLNANDAFGTSSATWNNTSPTSSVFTVGTPAAVNSSGSTFVAYLFASVTGVSKVGSYTGTGATQTINCGFTGGARFVIVKRTDNLGSWWVWDTARGMVSGTDPRLELNTTNAETNADWVYTTSTGFQVVSTNSEVNASGGTYIYLAIA